MQTERKQQQQQQQIKKANKTKSDRNMFLHTFYGYVAKKKRKNQTNLIERELMEDNLTVKVSIIILATTTTATQIINKCNERDRTTETWS